MAFVIVASIIIGCAAFANFCFATVGYEHTCFSQRVIETPARNILCIGSAIAAILFMASVQNGFHWEVWCGWIIAAISFAILVIAIMVGIHVLSEEGFFVHRDCYRNDSSVTTSCVNIGFNMIPIIVCSIIAAYT